MTFSLFSQNAVWTSPKTFLSGEVLTSDELNIYLRDNFCNLETAKAVTPGSLIVASGQNEVAERMPTAALVSISESQTGGASTTYADLATVGPTVTVDTGSMAIVFIYVNTYHTAPGSTFTSFAVTGASEIAATDDMAVRMSNSVQERFSACFCVTNLNPGLNTFTAKYRIGNAGTGTWMSRRLIVFPL